MFPPASNYPETRESIVRAKAENAAERARIVTHQQSAKDAVTVLLDLYPEALPALRVFVALGEVHGYATVAKHVANATWHPCAVSSITDPRR